MGTWLDDLARDVARSQSRRAALRRIGGGLSAVVVAAIVPSRVAAQDDECPEGTTRCGDRCVPPCHIGRQGIAKIRNPQTCRCEPDVDEVTETSPVPVRQPATSPGSRTPAGPSGPQPPLQQPAGPPVPRTPAEPAGPQAPVRQPTVPSAPRTSPGSAPPQPARAPGARPAGPPSGRAAPGAAPGNETRNGQPTQRRSREATRPSRQ
jgi:hypothetical protein